MADRELIAATLAAGVFSGKNVPVNEEGAAAAALFYRQVLTALAKADTAARSAEARRSY